MVADSHVRHSRPYELCLWYSQTPPLEVLKMELVADSLSAKLDLVKFAARWLQERCAVRLHLAQHLHKKCRNRYLAETSKQVESPLKDKSIQAPEVGDQRSNITSHSDALQRQLPQYKRLVDGLGPQDLFHIWPKMKDPPPKQLESSEVTRPEQISLPPLHLPTVTSSPSSSVSSSSFSSSTTSSSAYSSTSSAESSSTSSSSDFSYTSTSNSSSTSSSSS
eukprot:Gregarina_sp_Poly_1__3646@NODE_2074_length_2733_cov_7_565266_g1338_i0_p2_GENE_NODE_2074_length_2733_cov_7_565266_g1338_i0NODE_2074_length_2733_cov_7_565266_g1338_i0_p2_ORF_typecomplete_len221_score20_01_NODE_2074_length_2733_cov_7_565266_g1338_i04621124